MLPEIQRIVNKRTMVSSGETCEEFFFGNKLPYEDLVQESTDVNDIESYIKEMKK